MSYHVYILHCNDGTYYTGITNNLTHRIHVHNTSPQGAKYTKSRRPVFLAYEEECSDKGSALRREHEIKTFSRAKKARIIATYEGKRV